MCNNYCINYCKGRTDIIISIIIAMGRADSAAITSVEEWGT